MISPTSVSCLPSSCWYDLRDNACYILASPAEIMGKGIPYHKVLPLLFSRDYPIDRRLASAASAIVEYWRELSLLAAFTVVATAGLQGVADAVKRIFAAGVEEPDFGEIQYLQCHWSPNTLFFRPERLSEEHYRKRCGEECLC